MAGVRRWQGFGLAALWMLGTVSLFTAWDRFGLHEAFRPARLMLRVVVFGLAAAGLTLWLRRQQGRRG